MVPFFASGVRGKFQQKNLRGYILRDPPHIPPRGSLGVPIEQEGVSGYVYKVVNKVVNIWAILVNIFHLHRPKTPYL